MPLTTNFFILVKPTSGYKKELTYSCDFDQFKKIKSGHLLVFVPLRNQIVLGKVCRLINQVNLSSKIKIKKIIKVSTLEQNNPLMLLIKQISLTYFVDQESLYKKISLHKKLSLEKKSEICLVNKIIKTPKLSLEQELIAKKIDLSKFSVNLIDGVTGSGKTKIYIFLMQQIINSGKSIIIALPEVFLCNQIIKTLSEYFDPKIIYPLFSGTSKKTKEFLAQEINSENPVIIVGVHLPVLTPIKNLGLIIVDEEHEQGFLEKQFPRLDTKELLIWRGKLENTPIILGSATPSATTFYRSKKSDWNYFKLNQRFKGQFPAVQKVILKKKKQGSFWISDILKQEIQDRLNKKEQAIIFLNRRGHSLFVICSECNLIKFCQDCSVALTLHNKDERFILICHYCSLEADLPLHCPCSKKSKFLKRGIGTQRFMDILQKEFPNAKIIRADTDSAKKKSWLEEVKNFEKGQADIIVGTKIVSKGLNFPKVTLVGIIWLELDFSYPDFRSKESGISQILQVAGRTGRFDLPGKVIIQTTNENLDENLFYEKSYSNFLQEELETRKLLKYPPFSKLLKIELSNINQEILEKESQSLALQINHKIKNYNLNAQVLGPSIPSTSKINKKFFKVITIKFFEIKDWIQFCKEFTKPKIISDLSFYYVQ